MDRKQVITATLVALAAILLYYQVLGWLGVSQPAQPGTPPSTQAAIASTAATSQPSSGPAVAAAPAGLQAPSTQPTRAMLGSAAPYDARYSLQADVLSQGAGFGGITLNQFKREARSQAPYVFEEPIEGHPGTEPLATHTVTVNGTVIDLATVQWAKSAGSTDSAMYVAQVENNNQPVLRITKTFRVFDREKTSNTSQGYELAVDYGLENLTDQPMTVRTEFNGPTTPPAENYRSGDRQIIGGYVEGKAITLGVHAIEELKSDKDNGTIDLTKDKNLSAAWVGTFSNYFASIVLFGDMGGGPGGRNYISRIIAHGVNLDSSLPEEHAAYVTLETTDLKLDPHKSIVLPMSVFAGPKWRQVLDNAYYSSFPRDYGSTLVIRSGCYSYCTFEPLMQGMVYLLRGIHYVIRDWGLAIIGLVIIVRAILHPITKRSQVSMAKMSKMGPEMERLKKKYADDKEALNKAMWEFQKEQGLTPILGCLPMLLQMPIWVALYGVLQSTFELRQAPFLWNLTWIHDLAQPDQIVRLSHPVQLWFFELRGINLLPILMAVAFFFQQKLTPKPTSLTPEQAQQQKMMQWTSLIFPVFLYTYPSGLNLYILTSTAIGVVESKIVRDHIRQKEEAEKAGKVFVETKPTRASRRGKNEPPDVTPKRGLAGWWANLLAQAEQVKNEADRRGKRKA